MTDQITVNLTPTAAAHIARQLTLTQASYLRLGVKESGCNGHMYVLDYLQQPAEDDLCFDFEQGVKICVSQSDTQMVDGTEVDMITEGLNSALVFKNPKATSYCGCGESFAVGGAPEDNHAVDPNVSELATNVGAD